MNGQKDLKIFEFGCGDGGILFALKQLGCDVYGNDFDSKTVEFGRSKGLTLELGDEYTLKKYGQADIIILSHVLEHIKNPIK